MATLIETRLREAMAEYMDTYNRTRSDSIFASLVLDKGADQGFFKPAVVTLPGEPTEFTGNATVHSQDSASVIYETKVFEYTLGIDRNLLAKTDAISRGEVSRIIRGMANKAVGHMDKRLTTLLLTGESTGNIGGGAFFSATVAIPGGSTLDNLVGTSVSGSAAEVLSSFCSAQAHFISMRNAGNDLVTGVIPKVGVMYDPRATNGTSIHKNVLDALNPDFSNDVSKPDAAEYMMLPNGYLSGSVDDIWFFDMGAMDKAFTAGWQQRPVLESNVGVQTDSDRLLNRRDLFQTSWSYEVAFGSPYSAVLGNDA